MENDSITKSSNRSLVPLSQAKMDAIQSWREQPKQFYATLPTTTPRKMIEAETPTLWELRTRLGHPAAIAILVNAFIHAAKLVNLDKNLTPEQIGEVANDTLELHGQLKVEEIKFLLKRALRTQNVYGRLDYNVLMGWIEQYDAERTEEAMRISEREEAKRLDSPYAATAPRPPVLEQLRQAAADGLPGAAEAYENLSAILSRPESAKSKEQKEKEFRLWKLKYYSHARKNK